jgi:hypothetical protein
MRMLRKETKKASEMSVDGIHIVDAFESIDLKDIEQGIVRGVKLLGLRSKNGRDYNTEGVRKTARKVLEGARVYVDHPEKPGQVRSYKEAFGFTDSVEYIDGKGYYGNVKFNPQHPQANQFIWDVKNNPTGLGMSINARIRQSAKRGTSGLVAVEAIEECRSVDLVTRPATADGIFESESESVMKLSDLSAEVVEELKAQIRKDLEPSKDAMEAEKARTELADLKKKLAEQEAIASAAKLKGEVTESVGKILKDIELPEGVMADLVECACSLQEDVRAKLTGTLEKISPLLKVTSAEEDDAADEGEETEESHKEEKKIPAKIGGAKKKSGGLDLRSSLGLKAKT